MIPKRSHSDAVEHLAADVPVLDKQQAATLLATTPRHVERLVQDGRLSYCRVGRFIRFRLPDILRYLQETHVTAQVESSNEHDGTRESR